MIARWSLQPRWDWIVALITVAAWQGGRRLGWTSPLEGIDAETRRAVYSQAGTVGAAAIGLFVVPVSLALALAPRERLQRVLSQKRDQVRRAVMHAGGAASLLIVFTVVAIALDTAPGDPDALPPVPPASNSVVRLLAPGLFVLVGLSLARVLRVLGAVLKLNEVEERPSMADRIKPVGPTSLDADKRCA